MLTLNGVSLRDAMSRARALLERLDLGRRADVHPATLSGGEQQRLAVARAVVNDPAVTSRMSRPRPSILSGARR